MRGGSIPSQHLEARCCNVSEHPGKVSRLKLLSGFDSRSRRRLCNKKKVILTQKQLEAKLEYWQNTFRYGTAYHCILGQQSAMSSDKAAQVTICLLRCTQI